jgi:hypothetical protein
MTTVEDNIKSIYEKYKNEFKCVSIENNRWYHFNNHKWNLDEQGKAFKIIINDADFIKCQELFYDNKFEDNLDLNDNLLHFMNGVYDLDTNEFRKGEPTDNITLSTHINYIDVECKINIFEEDINVYSEKIMYLYDFIKNTITKGEYLMVLLASFLHGVKKENHFNIWFGNNKIGKSMLIDLYKKTLGDYCHIISPEDKDDISISTKNKRVVFTNNYGSVNTLINDFNLVFNCDEFPEDSMKDKSSWKFIHVAEFDSNSSDDNTTYNLDGLEEILMKLLIQKYQKNDKCFQPDDGHTISNIKHYGTRFEKYNKLDSVGFSQFVEETITPDPSGSFSIDEILPRFRAFLQSNDFDTRKYSRRELEKRLNKIIGKCNGKKKWKGWKFYEEEDEEEKEDEDEDKVKNTNPSNEPIKEVEKMIEPIDENSEKNHKPPSYGWMYYTPVSYM